MAGIGYDRQFDVLIGEVVDALMTHAQVVLYISRTLISCIQLGIKLAEDLLERLACHISKHIQTSPVNK